MLQAKEALSAQVFTLALPFGTFKLQDEGINVIPVWCKALRYQQAAEEIDCGSWYFIR